MIKISKNNEQNVQQLKGSRVAVLGAARSGISLARLLARAGAKVLLSDVKPLEQLKIEMNSLQQLGIETEWGGHSERILESDLICISPGIPLTIPILQQAQSRGIPITGELEVTSWFCRAPIIAITGSNGKTTTTTLIGEILKAWNPNILVGGNIGSAFAEQLEAHPRPDWVVLEVSSFQLETIVNFHPKIAAILNLSPNHLDRYDSYDDYIAAKMRILMNLTEDDIVLFNMDDSLLPELIASSPARKLCFSVNRCTAEGTFWEDGAIIIQWEQMNTAIPLKKIALRGPHNRYNMMVAATIARLVGVPEEVIQQTLENFKGIEHRLEKVATVNGVTFYNDSKATTVASLGYALQSFEEPIVLIAGGKDKGGDFSELNPLLADKVRAAVLIGQARERMYKAWQGEIPIEFADTLKEAVAKAYAAAKMGDVVLLSPACSSFDMFEDYEDRGRQFKKIVMDLLETEQRQKGTNANGVGNR